MSRQPVDARNAAETIALRALAFLASDSERLGRFLALTGIGPDELRTKAREPRMLAGVLDHLMGDETLLLVFATDTGLKTEAIASAYFILAGPPPEQSI